MWKPKRAGRVAALTVKGARGVRIACDAPGVFGNRIQHAAYHRPRACTSYSDTQLLRPAGCFVSCEPQCPYALMHPGPCPSCRVNEETASHARIWHCWCGQKCLSCPEGTWLMSSKSRLIVCQLWPDPHSPAIGPLKLLPLTSSYTGVINQDRRLFPRTNLMGTGCY